MSWRASAYVKPLITHSDGTLLTAREKLILFVLADSHNDDFDYAWPGITRAAEQSLTSRRRFIELIKRLEEKGTITVERREGRSNLYRFPGLVQSSHPPKSAPVQELHPTSATAAAPPRAIASAPEPSSSLNGTDIAPQADASTTILSDAEREEKFRNLNQLLDDWYARRWQTDEAGKKYLLAPASPHSRVYEGELQ